MSLFDNSYEELDEAAMDIVLGDEFDYETFERIPNADATWRGFVDSLIDDTENFFMENARKRRDEILSKLAV